MTTRPENRTMLFAWIKYLRRRITPEQLHRRMAGGEKFLVVDVRTAREYEEDRRMPGALHMPMKEFRKKGPELVRDSDKPVVIYCSRGVRSLYALSLAADLAEEALSLSGGLLAWEKRGYEVIRPPGARISPAPSRKEC